MLTLALQLGLLSMFQKFEQTMVNQYIRYNGPILWNETDERFKIQTSYSFKRELSSHFINSH